MPTKRAHGKEKKRSRSGTFETRSGAQHDVEVRLTFFIEGTFNPPQDGGDMRSIRCAVYTRVSLNRQDTAAQRAELTEYVQRRGWEPKYYTDEGQSGAKESRPGLDAMLRDVRQRKVDVVVIWALDRLARSLKQLLNILEEFHQLGVNFVSYKQQLDTSSPVGRLTYQILGAFAEFEREILISRVKSGMLNAKRRGHRIGRPPLRQFSSAEIAAIRLAHTNERKSVRRLAKEHQTTQYVIARILSGQSQASQKGMISVQLRRPFPAVCFLGVAKPAAASLLAQGRERGGRWCG